MKQGKAQAPKTGMPRLLELASIKKTLVIASVCLSSLAAVCSFIPYIAIYLIMLEIISIYPDFNTIVISRTLGFGWMAFGGILLNIVLYFAALMCSHLAAFGTLYELKVDFASHLAKVPLGFHVLAGSGKLRKIMDENIEKIEGFIAHQLPDLAASLVSPVVMLIILMVIDWRMGLASIAGIVLALYIQIKGYSNEGAKRMMEKYQDALEDMNNASVEYVRGITVVKAFGQTVYSLGRMYDAIKNYTKMVIPYTLSWENVMSAFTTVVNNIYLFVVPAGILLSQLTDDYISFAGTFIFYLIFVPSIAAILTKIMYVTTNSMQIIGGVERMDSILSQPHLVQPEHAKQISSYDIEFEHVSFTYSEQDVMALSDVSFGAGQGQVTAIVGPSGGGKTTIANLIPRFFDVTEGSIKIGGTDVREMNSSYLMEKVSFVFQDVFLFKQSVMENIRIGNMNAPIIVLDEATAFSDPENEYLIQKAFEKLMNGKTVIMIAHRLSTIKSAGRIVVMDNGTLVEQGTHEELMAAEGKYHDMWNMYTKTLSWKMDRKEESYV